MKRLASIASVFALLLAASAFEKKPQQFADLTFTVLKSYNDKPVRNAAVILHPVNRNGKQATGGAQLKTDGDGKTVYTGIPYGKVRIQVIAPGFQTFGEDYDIAQPTHDIVIKLKEPKDQYSIYK